MNRTIIGFLRKEFAQALRDPRMKTMLFVAPIVQVIIFGFALNSDIKNVKLAYHGKSKSKDLLLEQLYKRSLASGLFIPANSLEGEDPFSLIQSGTADVVLVAPAEGLTRSVERGDGNIQLLINATNAVRSQGIEQMLTSILSRVVAEKRPEKVSPPLLNFDIRILHNPTLETALFLVPGVMAQLACLITIVLTSMSLSREKEMGTFETLLAAPLHSWEIIAGKMLPFIVLGTSNIPMVLIASHFLFGIPVKGPLWMLLVSSVVFVTTTVSIGILISTIAKNQQQAMMGGFLFLFPSILLSGLMFPIENMPLIIRLISYINPLTYFIKLLRNILLKGGDLHIFFLNTSIMGLMALIFISIGLYKFKSNIS